MKFSKENKVQSKEDYHTKIIIKLFYIVAVTKFEIWVSWPWKRFFTTVLLGFEMASGKAGCRKQSRNNCAL